MKIDYDGRIWDFDVTEMTVAQCEAVERHVGKGLGEWANQLKAGSIKSLEALWWVIRSQAGEDPGPLTYGGDPSFRPVKLLVGFNEGEAAELAEAVAAEAEAEPDPTRPAGSSQASAATTTTPGAGHAIRSRRG